MTGRQLDIEGNEVELPVVPRAHSPFTSAQREIMERLRDFGRITSSDAGLIVHLHRTPPCARCVTLAGAGGCAFVASDGRDALKRLQIRGLVRRVAPGKWEATAT